MTEETSLQAKFEALYGAASYRPLFAVSIVVLSLFAAVLEGLGLSFLLPIIELARSGSVPSDADGTIGLFVSAYRFLGVPFTLEAVIVGVSLVMVARYTSSFLVAWFRAALRVHYVRELQTRGFENALSAEVAYFDESGSDEILNAIVTQSKHAGRVIKHVTWVVEQSLLSLMYLGIALYLAPGLTIAAAVILGGLTYLLRAKLEGGYTVGDRVADANERIQETVQAGMQGIRDVKLFGLSDELFADFLSNVEQFAESTIRLRRNEAALDNIHQLMTAVTVFVLIYGALTFSSLSLGSLGVFLFAIFRLAPRVSTLNNRLYKLDGELPHLVRTQEFVDELSSRSESSEADASPPSPVERVTFDDVSFAYDANEQVFDGLSFSVERSEFAAFVGPSGAGKSTIVSLLTRMYDPDSGEIRADGTPVNRFDLSEWRSRISLVRQNPYIFNDTLERNVTVGKRDATREEVKQVCEIAQVTEFVDDLPNGYETVLGDDGVRLSGGQKQRVALARALLKDADLLVLDEATSDLDSNIEADVHGAIESMDRDYTVLVIAHRLSTVVNADCIYAVEDGEIIESGTHSDLISNDGTYADLYATQARDVSAD